MTNTYTFPNGDEIPIEYYEHIVKFIRNQLANNLEQQATYAMISDEYNFNDTAVRAKTYHHAAQIVRGKSND
jgi:hypothetical protein